VMQPGTLVLAGMAGVALWTGLLLVVALIA